MDLLIFLGLALGIVLVIVTKVTPAALSYYGHRYFPDLTPPPRRGVQMVLDITFLLVLIAGLIWLSKMPVLAPSLAMILGAFYGIYRCDKAYQIIPDRFHLIGLAGTIAFLATGSYSALWSVDQLWVPLAVGLALPLGLLAINFLYTKLRGRTGLGLGDIKLCGWLAPLLGSEIYTMLFLACVLAVVMKLPTILRDRNVQQTFAFGPYIVVAAVAILFFQA